MEHSLVTSALAVTVGEFRAGKFWTSHKCGQQKTINSKTGLLLRSNLKVYVIFVSLKTFAHNNRNGKKTKWRFSLIVFFLFDDEIQPLMPTHDFIYLYSKRSEITLCEMRRVQVLDRCVHWLIAALCSSLTLNNYLLPPQKSRYVHSGRPKSTLQYFAYTCTQ